MRRPLIALAVGVGLVALAACGGGGASIGSSTVPFTPSGPQTQSASHVTVAYAGTTTLSAHRHTASMSGTTVTVTYNGQVVGTGTLDSSGKAAITLSGIVPLGSTVSVTAGSTTATFVLANASGDTAVLVQVNSDGTLTVTTADGTQPQASPPPGDPDGSSSVEDTHGDPTSVNHNEGKALPANLPIAITSSCTTVTITTVRNVTFSRLRFEENVHDGDGGSIFKYDGPLQSPQTFSLIAQTARLHFELFDSSGKLVLEIQAPVGAFTAVPGQPSPASCPTSVPTDSPSPAATGSSLEKAWLRASLAQSLPSFATKMSTGDTSTSDLGYAALAELAVGSNPVAAASYLKREVAVQRPDGTLPSLERSNSINDANATAFCAESWGPILLRFSDRLDPGTRETLRSSARRALTALRTRSVSLDYTNIALMQAVDVLLLGDALSDRDAVQWATQRLDDWIALTADAGIHEYDSPTYYRVDFDELSVGAAFTLDAGARRRLRTILNYFWNDVGVHVVGERFGGAHSRDYDFPGRTLTLHTQLALAGLATPSLRPLPAIPMDILTYLGSDEVARVPDTAVRVAATVHTGEGRYTSDPNDTWYLSDNHNVLLGSADGDYGPIDKPIDVTFNEWISGIAVVPEGTGDPYGEQTALDQTGIAIPMHLLLHPVTVQQYNLLLAALDLDPREAGMTPQLTTNILLPVDATVAIDGTPVDLSHDQHIAFSPSSVVTLQTARAAVAVRVPLFEGVDGTTPSLSLVSDPEGRSIRSARIVVTSYSGPARALDASHARVIVLIAVADGNVASIASDIKSAQVTSQHSGSEVEARIGATTLAAEIDPNTRRPKRRTVNGNDLVQPPPLAVNGQAISL